MPSADPYSLRTAVQSCYQFHGEALYHCLREILGENGGASRTAKEVILRSLGIQVVSLASYGHLMSLQGFASSHPKLTLLRLFIFIFYPGFPAVELLIRTGTTIVQGSRRTFCPLQYWIAVWLGLSASTSGKPVALKNFDARQVRQTRSRYNLAWVGRFLLLLLLLAQFSGSLSIIYRSLFVFTFRPNLYIFFDKQTLQSIIGGLVVVIHTILVSLLNLEWEVLPSIEEPAIEEMVELSTIPENSNDLSSHSRIKYHLPASIESSFEITIILRNILLMVSLLMKPLRPRPTAWFELLDGIEPNISSSTAPHPL